jgi:multiple sugar transport system substrate-binding protein
MKFTFKHMTTLAGAVALAFGAANAATAQSTGAYVNTFDLQLPTQEGEYAGVDPSGASVVFWHNHTGARDEAVIAAVAQFNEENPWGITVEPISRGSYNDIYQAILAGLQTGELPELTVAYQNEAATYQNAESLVNLDAFVNDPVLGFGDDFTNDFFQGFLANDFNPQFNQRLGMTVYRSMEVLYYNADALEAMGYDGPPTTWEEFREMSCRYVQEGLGTDGYQIRTDASFIAAAAFAAGGDIYDYENNQFTYDTEEAKQMPRVMQEMLNEGCAQLVAERFGDQNAFIAQAALFYTGSSSGLPFVRQGIQDSGSVFRYDIAAIPGYGENEPTQNVYGASVSIPNSTPEQELAAWLFVRWYDEPTQQAFWARQSNYFPVRQSTAAGLGEYFAEEPAYESAFNLLGNTKAEPGVAGYNPVRALAQDAFNNILDGADVDETFATLNEEANRLLSENQPGGVVPTPVPTNTPEPTAEATAGN